MTVEYEEIQVRGKPVLVPARRINGRTVVVSGTRAQNRDNQGRGLAGRDARPESARVYRRAPLERSARRRLRVCRGGHGRGSRLAYRFEWDNVAAIRTSHFKAWWDALPQEARKNARRAAKRGVEVKPVELDDDLVAGIKHIYDESPLRQGRPFWHYGKSLQRIMADNATYADRSQFVGAYHGDELIGFMKWVCVGDDARIMQVMSLNSHADKRPMNALIVKAAEICHERRINHLFYGRFTYGNKRDTSIGEFKRRMGFEQIDFPDIICH